jgi:thiosulfate/3-mercaptopyruvate sulfurtransferase
MQRSLALGVAILGFAFGISGAAVGRILVQQSPAPLKASSVPSSYIVEPKALANELALEKQKPLVVCVGFKALYDSAHIPGALYLGPARTPAGIESLEKWAEGVPRSRPIVIYCGCCPWSACPNIGPAFEALRRMKFEHLKVVHIEDNFAKDWLDPGYPVEKNK